MSVINDIDLTPITRLEYDIAAILNDHAVAEPITRIELILADIVAGNTTTVEPVTRIETYLAIISGADYPVPKPVTRIETFLAIIAGEDYEEPEAVTRLEGLLAEWVEKGSGIWKTVTGTLIHITNALASPMQKCEVTLEPIQDLHGQDAPYPAGGGKNKLQVTATSTTLDGITFTINSDGTVLVDGTSTAPGTRWLDLCFFDNTISFPEEMLLSSGVSVNGLKLAWFKGTSGSGDYVATADGVSVPANTVLKSVTIGITGGATINNALVKPMIRSASIADSSFAPYSNICPITGWTGANIYHSGEDTSNTTVYAVSWQDEAGTVYGGTVDVTSGLLTVDRAKIVLDGTQEIFVSNWRPTSTSVGWIYRYNLTNNKVYSRDQDVPNILCNTLEAASYGSVYYGTVDNAVTTQNGTDPLGGICIRIGDTSLTNNTAINNYLSANPIEVVYELAEPLTYQLTPQEISTLKGVNNVWSNSNGDTTIIYKAQAE